MAVLLVLGFFFVSNSIEYLKELIAFFFFIAALFSIVLLFSNNKIRKILTILFLLILLVLLVIKLSFYSHYGTKVSASALFVIFETNGLEASEFLTNYINLTVVGIMCVCIIVLGLAIYFLNKPNYINFESNLRLKLFSLLILFLSLGIIHFKFSSENIIISSVKSFSDYKITKSNLKKNLAQPLSNNIKVKATSKEEKTYVVVIGESTSKWHMQLYGYGRETNPKLSAIKDELVIFDSIITPNVHTLRALEKILTLSDFHFPNRENNASLVQMANAAGFETFWISNQKPVGIYESIPTIISSAAKHKTYANTKESGYAVYDEILLPYLKEALDSKAKQKLIFIHLIGTHAIYNKRYPETFDFFKDETNTDFKHSKSKRTINEYDNAIRYNDFVLREIIEQVRIKNENSYVVYFSDHGDEVYDTFDFVGHNEYHGTRPMYEIPFIAWFSNKYKANNLELFNFKKITKRPYVLEDFIHSFSEISNITFDRFDAKKSIFNQGFNKKLRLVKKGEDYDKR
ncbi:sulfatase-like hydrolase/transferase [Lacinutrix mariniflava]|uniref:sulfatase-like hydrolase/transferase n=1 Tax=Lacinutrix mariniflava TaxID=342955 RepID=UPI00128EDB83|nr:sulfatase-like hydrolase/transferase [Lacinutrix mariniflava]